MRRVSVPTDIVQRAQKAYPKNLASVASYFGPIPYGKKVIDARTADQQYARMTDEDMARLAQTDPMNAEKAAARVEELNKRASSKTPLPGAGSFEGNQ